MEDFHRSVCCGTSLSSKTHSTTSADSVMSKPQYLTGDKPAIQDFLKRFDVRAFPQERHKT